jgi:CubicO group peptidase (beta-lactamase class C family)
MRKIIIALFYILIYSDISGQSIDVQLQNVFNNRKLMGMSVVAVYQDSVIYSGNIGIADYSRNIPITDSTMYRIASISKTITATAFMMLYEKGLFKMDDDISNILGFTVRNPYFPDVSITPRMLLSHTSSIQDGTGYGNFIIDTYYKDTPPSITSLLSDTGTYYTCDLWQDHEPRSYFMYSNLNFVIIGTLIEKLSGQRFDIYCKQHILEPLGITGSYNIQDIKNLNNLAVLYRAKEGIWQAQADNFKGLKPPPRDLSDYVIGSNGLIFGPHGGLRISAGDLSKIMLLHMNGGVYKGKRLLQDSVVALMHRPQWNFNGINGDTYYGLFRSWGLGFQLATNCMNGDLIIPGFTMTGHIGESYGLISDMFFDENNKFGMIFMTNGSAADFEYGTCSAFYALDEDIFSTLFYMAIQPCMLKPPMSDLGKTYKTNYFYDPESTNINARFYLQTAGKVSCKIFNSLGSEVAEHKWVFDSDGRKQLTFDTKNMQNGLYFVIIQSEENRQIMKLNIDR